MLSEKRCLEKQIDRYLAEGLASEDERALRAHLRGCADCRAYYDRQVLLYRALAGDPSRPSPSEKARIERLVLRAAEVEPASPTPAPGPLARLTEAMLWNPGRAFAAAAALLILTVSAALLVIDRPRAVPAATFAVVRNATVEGQAASEQQVLLSGETLTVAGKGVAELQLVRGGKVRVFPGTELSLAPRGSTVELVRGRVWCEVERVDGDEFRVRTADAEARVLGTSFVVEAEPGRATEVRVVSGTVEVVDREGKGAVRVKGGEKSRVRAGEPPSPVRRYVPEEDIGFWNRMFRAIGRTIEKGLRKAGELLEGAFR